MAKISDIKHYQDTSEIIKNTTIGTKRNVQNAKIYTLLNVGRQKTLNFVHIKICSPKVLYSKNRLMLVYTYLYKNNRCRPIFHQNHRNIDKIPESPYSVSHKPLGSVCIPLHLNK